MNDKQMELFLPGLLVFIISAIFIFMVLPRMGTVVLAAVCALSLVFVLIHHYSMFSSEYRLSTWQNGLATYAPFLLIGVSIIIVIGVIISLFTGDSVVESIQAPIQTIQSGITASLNAMPSAATATNPVTSALNSAIKNNKSLIPTLGYRASNV
jgi:hypothetical protein